MRFANRWAVTFIVFLAYSFSVGLVLEGEADGWQEWLYLALLLSLPLLIGVIVVTSGAGGSPFFSATVGLSASILAAISFGIGYFLLGDYSNEVSPVFQIAWLSFMSIVPGLAIGLATYFLRAFVLTFHPNTEH